MTKRGNIVAAWLMAFMAAALVAGCGVHGGGGGSGTTADAVVPTFNGVSVAVPSAVGGYVTLSWDAATDNVTASNALVYDISVATAAGASFAATYTTPAGATSYTVSGLTNNTDYYFVVRARDAAGNRDTNIVEAATHELMGAMNLRGVPMLVATGDIAFTYFDFCNTNTLDFGDGSSVIQNCPIDNSDVTVNHQYAAAGTYTVTMTESPSGNSEYIKLTVTPVAKVGVAAHQVVISNSATSGGTWSGANPDVFTPNTLGAKVAVTDIQSRLSAGTAVTITTSTATGGNGDISVNDAVSWSASALTLSAERDIKINAVMTASATSSLLMNTATAVAGGAVKAGMNAGSFIGRVDFPGRFGTGFLTINGNAYTVITSLGAAGSVTTTDLQGMSGNLAGRYALGSNIDATVTSGWNGGSGFLPVGVGGGGAFTGAFEGLGHTITGLTINMLTNGVGLFGVASASSLGNVGLTGGSVTGQGYVGGLAGDNANGSIIINSYNTGSVTGANLYTGGLAGANSGGITNSYSTGSVSGTGDVGGLVGYSAGLGTITNSYSTGSVNSSGSNVGGLAGELSGTITNSYSTGAVTAGVGDSVGGLVGYSFGGLITNSYSAGAVSGATNVGGLVGRNVFGVINTSFWDTQTSGWATSVGGTGLTTAQMRAQASFTGWDFATVWSIVEGVSYPALQGF